MSPNFFKTCPYCRHQNDKNKFSADLHTTSLGLWFNCEACKATLLMSWTKIKMHARIMENPYKKSEGVFREPMGTDR